VGCSWRGAHPLRFRKPTTVGLRERMTHNRHTNRVGEVWREPEPAPEPQLSPEWVEPQPFTPDPLRPGKGRVMGHRPCPECGRPLILRRDGALAVAWVHAAPECEGWANALRFTLSRKGNKPGDDEPAAKVQPRRVADPAYAARLNTQRDWSGHDTHAQAKAARFTRGGNPGALQDSLARFDSE
jgi:hypothetical protein